MIAIFSRNLRSRVGIATSLLFAYIHCQDLCSAQSRVMAGESAWHPSGMFAYKQVLNGASKIHFMKVTGGEPTEMFAKNISVSIKPPICFSNTVVVVTTEGAVSKFNLTGNLAFEMPIERFAGIAGFAGRFGDAHIYVTETIQNVKKEEWEFYLYIIDVSGAKAVVVSRQSIIQPVKLTRVSDEIVILGREKTQRLKIPLALSKND